jgi:P-type E1-E2 ATPase
MIRIDIPGRAPLELFYLLLDVNGTLTNRGVLIEGVAERLALLRERIALRLLSADTFGAVPAVAAQLGAEAQTVRPGEEKLTAVRRLGASSCAAIGNGANDRAMLEAAGLGIAVIGSEGVASDTVAAADVVCLSILNALDLLADERALLATLRL